MPIGQNLKPTSNFTDNVKMDAVNKKIALVALTAGLFGIVVVGFKTGIMFAMIAGGLSYRNHHPQAFALAEAQMAKFVLDVKSYLEKNFPGHEKTFVMVGNYFKNVGDKAYELLRAIALPHSSVPSNQFLDSFTGFLRSGVNLARGLVSAR